MTGECFAPELKVGAKRIYACELGGYGWVKPADADRLLPRRPAPCLPYASAALAAYWFDSCPALSSESVLELSPDSG